MSLGATGRRFVTVVSVAADAVDCMLENDVINDDTDEGSGPDNAPGPGREPGGAAVEGVLRGNEPHSSGTRSSGSGLAQRFDKSIGRPPPEAPLVTDGCLLCVLYDVTKDGREMGPTDGCIDGAVVACLISGTAC